MHPGAGSIIDLLVRLPRAVAALPPTPVPGLVSPPPSSKAQPTVLRRAYRQRRSDGGSRASRRGGWLAGSSARPRVRDVMRPDMVRSPWITPPLPGWSAVKPRSTRPAPRFGRHRQAGRESPPTERHAMRVAPPRGLRSVASQGGGEKAAVRSAACRKTPRLQG